MLPYRPEFVEEKTALAFDDEATHVFRGFAPYRSTEYCIARQRSHPCGCFVDVRVRPSSLLPQECARIHGKATVYGNQTETNETRIDAIHERHISRPAGGNHRLAERHGLHQAKS